MIIGSSHLSYRVKAMLETKGYEAVHLHKALSDEPEYAVNSIATSLTNMDLSRLAMIYVLHEEDEKNLATVMALIALQPDIPITTTLFNENIRAHLQAAHKKLTIINTARLAAAAFVEAL